MAQKTKFTVDNRFVEQANNFLSTMENVELQGVSSLGAGTIRVWFYQGLGKDKIMKCQLLTIDENLIGK